MKKIIGLVLIVAGILTGLYLGVWVMFIGGIMLIANGIQTSTLTVVMLSWGIIRIFLAGLVGWLCAIILIAPGVVCLND